jgi:hypothetical protein
LSFCTGGENPCWVKLCPDRVLSATNDDKKGA